MTQHRSLVEMICSRRGALISNVDGQSDENMRNAPPQSPHRNDVINSYLVQIVGHPNIDTPHNREISLFACAW